MSPPPSPTFFVLLGGPGSGKGTHGQALAQHLGLQHLSTGAHFRDHIARRTPLGHLAQKKIDQGKLLPDDVANDLMRDLLQEAPDAAGFVLDGYPRSLPQAHALKKMLAERNLSVTAAIYLEVSDQSIIERLSGRLTCRQCGQTYHEKFHPPAETGTCDSCHSQSLYRREDDEPVTIQKRLDVFHQMIQPLLDFYRDENLLISVQAEGERSKVTDRVIASVQSPQPPDSPRPTPSPQAPKPLSA
jgi:adenylate kinase